MKQVSYWCQQHEKILRELGNWNGQMSCVPFNYRMRRTAEMFFPAFELDQSYAMFDKCCELNALSDEQKRIVREVCEKHGMREDEP